MKKQLILIIAMVVLLACALTLSVCAEEIDPNSEYYDKVYTDANGRDFPIYEKEGDTYYPLVWFAYEDGDVTKYVKAHFEDCTTLTHAASQGRLNGFSYTYKAEGGEEIELNASNAVVINLRGGKLDGGQDIRTFEARQADPSYSRIEAIYLPLTFGGTFGYGFAFSTLRVLDFDRNHTTPVSLQQHIIDSTKIESIFIPGSAKFDGNGQFQNCTTLKTIIFGAGFNGGAEMMPYTFANAGNIEKIYFLGDYVSANASNNGIYNQLTRISCKEYEALSDKSGKYAIYNCSDCVAFNNGVHMESDEIALVGNDFFAPIKITCVCAVEGCGARIETGEISAIVESKGYSASTFGKVLSVTQGFYVNKAALDTYRSYVSDIEIGLVAAVNGEKTEFTPNLESDKVIAAPIDTVIHSYIDIKVTGISEEQSETFIVFCMYITTGGKTYFLDGGKTGETVLGKSYADVLN